MKKLGLLGVLCAMLVLLSFNTHAVTINFDSLIHVDGLEEPEGTSYTEDGFTISAKNTTAAGQTFLYSFGTTSDWYRGSTALHNGTNSTSDPVMQLAASGGDAFNLTSIDLAEVNSGKAEVTFTGFILGGGTVTQSFTLDGAFTTGSGFQSFGFTGFNNLTHVEWNNADPFHQFDNIVVNTVPLPAAIWLFGSGLLGLLGVTRRRRSAV